ncbi:MAG: transcriptional regulator [Methanomicrobiales archaeon]
MMQPTCDLSICESVARRHIPRVRAELVRCLIDRHGFSQSGVATAMGISRAAVSQYMNNKRGHTDIPLPPDVEDVVHAWAERIVLGMARTSICEICNCVVHNADG